MVDYVTEVRVPAAVAAAGLDTDRFETATGHHVLGVVRAGRRLFGAARAEPLQADDVLLLETDTTGLRRLVEDSAFVLAERTAGGVAAAGLELVEAVVLPSAPVQGSSALSIDLRERYGLSLVAVARQGRRFEGRLRDATLATGDVLMVEGEPGRAHDGLRELGCLPLAPRGLGLRPRPAALSLALFVTAIALAATGVLSTAVAFAGAVVGMLLAGAVRPAEAYAAVDWPVIVLLGAMIPFGDALQASGTAALLGSAVLGLAGAAAPLTLLGATLVATMAVTPVLNNAATVVIMAPVALSLAAQTGLTPDPFLMAVAVGASTDFLTPFGHHNNTIVMAPGGYRFGDYARVGLPLTLLVFATAVVLIPRIWPLDAVS